MSYRLDPAAPSSAGRRVSRRQRSRWYRRAEISSPAIVGRCSPGAGRGRATTACSSRLAWCSAGCWCITSSMSCASRLQLRGRFAPQLFGISMMFVYYGYLVPLSRRIGRGFYADGIWSETGFVPYWRIGAVSWREGEEIALVIVSRLQEPGAPAGRAGGALRRRPPPAAGENRRPRYTVDTYRAGVGGARRDRRCVMVGRLGTRS